MKTMRVLLKIFGVMIVIGVTASFFMYLNHQQIAAPPNPNAEVRQVVVQFGKHLKNVALLAPASVLSEAIRENYAPLVTRELLATWEQSPTGAPGRTVSSPWPERIEIDSITLESSGSYAVEGRVVELTSSELEHGGTAAIYPVHIRLAFENGSWRIASFEKGPYVDSTPALTTSTTTLEQPLQTCFPNSTSTMDAAACSKLLQTINDFDQCVAAGFTSGTPSIPGQCQTSDGRIFNYAPPPPAAITGLYLCLPPQKTAGPQTDECALGLKADDGTYFALDTTLLQSYIMQPTGTRLKVSGFLVPLEQLNTDYWQKYPIAGILRATQVVEVE